MKKKRSLIINYKIFLLVFLFPVMFFISSCSSGKPAVEEEKKTTETAKEVVKDPTRKLLFYEIREREYIRSAHIKSVEKLAFSYDRKKKPVPEGKLSTITYNDKGVITKTLNYGSNSEISSTFDYLYSNDTVRVESRKYSPVGELENIFKYEYDDDGYKIKSSRYGPSGVLEKYYTYEYDDTGNLIKENWYDASGAKEFSILYRYENNKRSETVSYDGGDNIVSKYLYKYDDEGNIVEEIKYDADGKEVGFIQYIYSYY